MFVPSCARAKANEITNTPNLVAPFAVSPLFGLTKKYVSKSSGFQIGFPKVTAEEDDTMTPMKDVTAKPTGMVIN